MVRIKNFVPKVTKEEFERIKPKCNCGCNELIIWRRCYRQYGIPKYKRGHCNKGKHIQRHKRPILITKNEFDKTSPYYCNCPDKEIIEWQEWYKYRGIPEYKNGHVNKNRIAVVCETCGKNITRRPSEIEMSNHFFCSIECMGTWRSKHVVGESNPFYGKHHTEERKKWYRDTQVGKKGRTKSEEERRKISKAHKGRKRSEAQCKKQSITMKAKCHWKGDKNPKFNNWSRYKPYCEKFNEAKKEEVRNEYDRKCFLCNLDEKDNIMCSGKVRKLSVHHIDGDKEQGCNGKPFYLIPLCNHCHGRICESTIQYITNLINLLIGLYKLRDVWSWWDSTH